MLLGLCLSLLPLQDTAPVPAPVAATSEVRTLLSMRGHGPEACFVDAKDARLLAALRWIDDRLLELPGEIPEFEIPPPALELVLRLVGGPMSLAVGMDSEPIPGMPLPFVLDLEFARGSTQDAAGLLEEIAELAGSMGLPLTAPPEGEPYVLPAPVPAWLGHDETDLFVRVGHAEGLAETSLTHLLPPDAVLAMDGMMDYGAFIEQVLTAMPAAESAEMGEFFEAMDSAGLLDINYEWALGSDAERQYMAFNMPGWGRTARESGLLSETTLTPEFIAIVPEDATWASAVAFDLDGAAQLYQDLLMGLGEGLDLFAEFEQATGVRVQEEILDPLGDRLLVYSSETTGGGGLFSTVIVIELADQAAFLATWDRLEEAVDTLGRDEAKGYVRFGSWMDGEQDYSLLSFPGLPVPLELTMTTTSQLAIFALSPQAAQAALEQIQHPETSLLDNEHFQEQLPADMSGVMGIQFLNTPMLLRDGYGTMGLLTAALANGVRSPSDASREPGPILPTYKVLARDAKAIVGVSRLVGDDYFTEYRADRSHLVNATGLVGYIYNTPILGLVAAGALGALVAPRVAQAQEMAQDVSADVEIRDIYMALDHYAINNGGRYPESLQELVTLDEGGHSYLPGSDSIIDPWGAPYRYTPPSAGTETPNVECVSR